MNIAFIPVRGGSKSIPLKNIKPICGKPLVYWTVKAACECNALDKVFVATDSPRIRLIVEEFKNGPEAPLFKKAEVVGRSAESASDTASTESAMLEFAAGFEEFDNIVLIQATSPLLRGRDLENGFSVFARDGVDSVLSVVRQKRFHWAIDENGFARPTNYDVFKRPRRQEFEGYLVENGAFYITSKARLLQSRNRVSGNIATVEMDSDAFLEIDEPEDWLIIESLMKRKGLAAPPEIPDVKLLLTDCDGCLTDGGMYYSENGDELKKFNTRDGMGIALLKKHGIRVGIVTSENVRLNQRRAEKLKLDFLEMGCRDKLAFIHVLCAKSGISMENVCYIGDDLNDIDAIEAVGWGCCPADAMPAVQSRAKYVTATKGGQGVVREVADLILAARKDGVRHGRALSNGPCA